MNFPVRSFVKIDNPGMMCTLTILAKTPRKVNKYFPFNMSNLSEKSSTLQTFFNKNVKTETVSN